MECRLKRTAIHEAGHAVMSFLKLGGVLSATIVPDDTTLGHVITPPLPDGFDPDEEEFHPRIHAEVMVLLAGAVAEEIVFGKGDDGCNQDFNKAVDFAYYLTAMLQEYIDAKWDETVLFLKQHWSLVERVANELLVKHTLSQDELGYILSA